MLSQQALQSFLIQSGRKYPEAIAVVEPGIGEITYAALDALSDSLRDRLVHLGIVPGDRVGIYLHKSIDSLAAIFGILKCGAAYVPVDPDAPSARNAYILADCEVKAILVEEQMAGGLHDEMGDHPPALLVLSGTGGGAPLKTMLERLQRSEPAEPAETHFSSAGDLAYILYTSGSTGKPKGVMLSHQAAISYVDWCSEVFSPTEADRFSSHAPFHFDLSILDIYVPIKHGAAIVLIGEALGKEPARLAKVIADDHITCWYSTPSILSLLAQFGKLHLHDYGSLRIVLFAGEVFPIKHLKAVKALWPLPRFLNLYGPTETNVCTYHEIPEDIPESQTQPFPIGRACSHYRVGIFDEAGGVVARGDEGELYASGPAVMDGYWNLPERTANAFHVDAGGRRWYKTGDIVCESEDGNIIYVGRRDRMVKKRGYRVELGEIEAGLYKHPDVKEAAAVAFRDGNEEVRIRAFISAEGEPGPSFIEMKRFCVENLPAYMVPDYFTFLSSLPKTSTDKINYQELKDLAAGVMHAT